METIKRDVKEIMFMLSESVLLGEEFDESEYKDVYKKLKRITAEIEKMEKAKDLVRIPKLPEGDEYNGYPRILYAFICEKYSKNEFFSVKDMENLTGASKNQIRIDLERLETAGFIRYIDGKTGSHNTRFHKYKPTNLKY